MQGCAVGPSTTLTEPFSDAGLDGKGEVVGVSDTGVDELSCYFMDPKGQVPRSTVMNPFTVSMYPYRFLFVIFINLFFFNLIFNLILVFFSFFS